MIKEVSIPRTINVNRLLYFNSPSEKISTILRVVEIEPLKKLANSKLSISATLLRKHKVKVILLN